MRALVVAVVFLVACGSNANNGGDGGFGGGDDASGGSGSGGMGSGSGMGSGTSTVTDLRFGIVGDTRHEGTNAVSQTSCGASQTIIDAHPLTLLIVGHTHTYSHYSSTKEVVVGIGGAPLTSGTDYGYAVVVRNADGTITVTVYNYSSHAVIDTFKISATGAAA